MRRLVWLASLVVTSLAFVVVSPAAGADSTDDGAFLAATNAERAKVGAQPLRMMGDLVAVAGKQADAMAAAGRIFHNPNLTTDVQNWKTVGENVGRGDDEPQIQGLLMASPPHRANILYRDYSEVGIASVRSGATLYVAEVFRQPKTGAAAPTPAPAPQRAAASPPPRPVPVAAPAPLAAPPVLTVAPAVVAPPSVEAMLDAAGAEAARARTVGAVEASFHGSPASFPGTPGELDPGRLVPSLVAVSLLALVGTAAVRRLPVAWRSMP
jgi:hypothetical protein